MPYCLHETSLRSIRSFDVCPQILDHMWAEEYV